MLNDCKMTGKGFCPCPLENLAGSLSRKWTLTILVTIGNFGKLRFNEVQNKIGINSKTLSDRLKALEKINLLNKKVFTTIPPKVEYSLTKEGRTLRKAVIPLMNWAVKKQK
ncbi:transcriptional regulator, HxlR family protein [Candidatus Woesearchaeota archaeon CG10_big_fil_rev_8_21_14_0_10_30_7]|nr:MAG: transcriptional regulator, HxlR family protein [Candidatus Woesearchaeota archaeon CG10_big_fil_rev_8_21_14_0_10_30_7]